MDTESTVLTSARDLSCAVAHFSQGLQTVAFYQIPNDTQDALPVEVRSWRSEESLTLDQLTGLLVNWEGNPPPTFRTGISSEEVRGIPLGQIHRAASSLFRRDIFLEGLEADIPSSDEIEEIIKRRLIPTPWRNGRDFRAHARELKGMVTYLRAVYLEGDPQPMRAVADECGLDVRGARKLIDQARTHGYLTRSGGPVGGRATEHAYSTARLMRAAANDIQGGA